MLTAGHVAVEPGSIIRIQLTSGRIVRGQTLGLSPDVDGALVGGASLKLDDFWAIAASSP